MAKCLLYSAERKCCTGLKETLRCSCNGDTTKCDFYPMPWKQKPKPAPISDELIQMCQQVRECCYARHCASCKHNTVPFPACQDHLYAEQFTKNTDQLIKILKGETHQ